jgi:hypothetical protein
VEPLFEVHHRARGPATAVLAYQDLERGSRPFLLSGFPFVPGILSGLAEYPVYKATKDRPAM